MPNDFFSFEANAKTMRNFSRAFGFGNLNPREPELEPEYVEEYDSEPIVVDFELEPIETEPSDADIMEIEANQESALPEPAEA